MEIELLEYSQIIERKHKNYTIEDLVGMEESEALIQYYGASLWKINHSQKLGPHVGLVALYLYRRFALNTPVYKYDCKVAAIASVFLAGKLENGYSLALRALCAKIKGADEEEIRKCEMMIIEGNDYELFIKTPCLSLLGLYNDCELITDEIYKSSLRYLELTVRGDIIFTNRPSKLAAACALASILKLTELEQDFKVYLDTKYTLASQSTVVDIMFEQWYKELLEIVNLLNHEVNLGELNLKDINSRITKYRLENIIEDEKTQHYRPDNGIKRSVASPEAVSQPFKKSKE